ncbi:MAG TPA: DUF6036 family nucleotidyltransferase [Archangium sp.]|uniref:DUF6036 family nucleotidyltransferase n=1 Tax=Archangium sp. TaxID=1872627 RepID=UPI002E36F7B4|nr:DUF6036 family nucleotidyltransferase [Archangium sp.]HEX5748558.1 DUF6036 family nucleotidyltransferase [Archangium sp.]
MIQRFSADDVARLIRAADAHLTRPARLVIIGGMAVGLLANPSRSTTDLDVLPDLAPAVTAAFQQAMTATGLRVPLQPVGTYFAPESFQERLQPYAIPGLRHLEVLLPEPHDLALMKLARGAEHDLQAIELLHSTHPLDPQVLLERFHETWVTGPRSMFAAAYVVLIDRLFGPSVADAHERALEASAT